MHRMIRIALVLVAVMLAACSQRATAPEVPAAPTPSPTTAAAARAPASAGSATATKAVEPQPTVPAAGQVPGPAATATRRVRPAAEPSQPIPAAEARAESPWPYALAALDLGVPAGNSYGPRAMAIHPGLHRLYARTHPQGAYGDSPGSVTVFDLDTGEVIDVVNTGPDGYADGDLVVDTVRDRVYALNPGDTTATVLDARTLKTVRTIDGVDRLALNEDTGIVYVAGLASLRALDAESHALLADIALDPARALALELDPAAGRLYLAHENMGGGHSLAVFDAATLDRLYDVPLPGGPHDVLAVADPPQVLVTLDNGEQNLLWVLDARGGLMEEVVLGDWTQHTYLALDAAGGRLFLTREAYRQEGVMVRHLDTGRIERLVDLDAGPGRLAWDAAGNRLLASLTYADRLAVIDPASGTVTSVLPTAVTLGDLAVDPARGYLLVTDSADRLHVLTSDGKREVTVLTGGGEIAVDSRHGRYYTGGAGSHQVRILDADTMALIGQIDTRAVPVADPYHDDRFYLVRSGVYVVSLDTMTTTMAIEDTLPQSPGFSPNPAAVGALVDPDSGQLLVLINNGVPGSNNGNYLRVYEPDTYEKVFDDNERSPIYLDVDPTSDRAYVSRIRMDMRSTSLLTGGRAYTDRLDGLFGPLFLDPGLDTVYLSTSGYEEGHLVLIDATDLDVVGSVPIAAEFSLRALDTERHLLYLAAGGGRIEIWSATGGVATTDAPPVRAPLPVEQVTRLFVTAGTESIFAGSLYRSDDDGRTWHFLGTGLPVEGVGDLAISPNYGEDETLFAAQPVGGSGGSGVWKSDTGGRTWRMANDGLDDLAVVDLAISPAFADDQTLLALTRSQGLFRSTDAGRTWAGLADRYLPSSGTSYGPRGLIAVSPTYGDDQTLYIAHEGLHRSTDGGETWTRVLDTGAEALALAPDYAHSHTLYGWFGHVGLLRSGDGGDTWQPVSAGLQIGGYGAAQLYLAPGSAGGHTVYLIWEPSTPEEARAVWRSTDAGATWQRLAAPLPQAATGLELAPDGSAFLALDETGRLHRWTLASLPWAEPALPPLGQIVFDRLSLPLNFEGTAETDSTQRVLYAPNQMAGVLFSPDAGLTWADTGYPQRHLFGALDRLLVLASGEALAPTPLGLYRHTPGEGWTAVEGGLPPGGAVSGPERGDDGSLRLLTTQEGVARVFLSTDEGRTWTEALPPLPAPATADDLTFSPAFAQDRTAFVALSQGKPQRSVDGGEWQEIGPPGEWELYSLDMSPAFDRDGILFLRADGYVLWRSADVGDTWQKVSGPWAADMPPMGITPGAGYRLPSVTFSPDFARDRVVLTQVGETLYRSGDGGETWRPVLELDVGILHATLSPVYDNDWTLYLLQGQSLYRLANRGEQWRKMPAVPWSAFDELLLEMSPTFREDRTLMAWSISGMVYLSEDAGESWAVASAGLPPQGLRQVTFSPAYAQDGLIYAVPFQGGIYRYAGDGSWLMATEAPRAPRTAPTPRPAATRTPTPVPAPTAASVPQCRIEPGSLADTWQAQASRIGCPVEPERQLTLAVQPFEHGQMIWDSDERQIYVLDENGTWQAFEDTWQEGVDAAYDPALPSPPRQPQRGFGKVWRESLGGPDARIGWAVEPERAVAGWRQRFERGRLYWTDTAGGRVYWLHEDGTWQ